MGTEQFETTLANVGSPGNPEFTDSDVTILNVSGQGDFPAISMTADETDHTIDLGLRTSAPPCPTTSCGEIQVTRN